MEQKTKIHADEGKNDLVITRDFGLPVDLLFKAHEEPELFEQWMSHEYGSVKVTKWEWKDQGSWHFQTLDAGGTVVFQAFGVFHSFVPGKRITRTFEMGNSPFDVQLEFLEFEKLSEESSRLTLTSIYRSVSLRDQMLKLPFAQGLNMAHNRLEKLLGNKKKLTHD
jgi:uncharacterized protein YndB with AHSA1/START domain